VYFGGGSVSLATPEGCWHALKCEPAQALTDGTPDFLGAAALVHAYDIWDKSLGGMEVGFNQGNQPLLYEHATIRELQQHRLLQQILCIFSWSLEELACGCILAYIEHLLRPLSNLDAPIIMVSST
jgi:hypothetical protein